MMLDSLFWPRPTTWAMHIALSDAAWGVRRKHESQGGYFVSLMSVKALQGQLDQPYVVLDWRGYKLPRISRSSLNSEAQACAGAMDALEYLLIFWHACVTRGFELRHLDVHDISMQSAPEGRSSTDARRPKIKDWGHGGETENGWDENKSEMDFIRNPTGRWCHKDRSRTAVSWPSPVPCLLPAFRPNFPSCKEEDIGRASSLSQTQR